MKLKKIGKFLSAVLAIGFLIAVYTAFNPPAGVLVLEYHMVNDQEDDVCAVTTADFKQQLDYLAEQGYQPISLLDFMKAKKGKFTLPEKPVVLTFDDGYIDNYTVLLPILEERQLKGTVFMVTNAIGQDGYLSWGQLREMQARGMEIGSHTANHLPLDGMNQAQIEDEIKLSKLILEWNGIHTVYFLSYPNGIYNDIAVKTLADSEYLGAVTGHAGYNTFATDPYLLQRVNIPRPHFGLLEFKLRLLKAQIYTKLGILQHII